MLHHVIQLFFVIKNYIAMCIVFNYRSSAVVPSIVVLKRSEALHATMYPVSSLAIQHTHTSLYF
jgi:hypothetical protein